jgi:hypothetical protein
MPFLPPPPPAGGDAKTLVDAPSPPADTAPHAEAQGSHWWIWATLAVVAVGGGVAGYLYFRPKDQPIPTTSLGSYRF